MNRVRIVRAMCHPQKAQIRYTAKSKQSRINTLLRINLLCSFCLNKKKQRSRRAFGWIPTLTSVTKKLKNETKSSTSVARSPHLLSEKICY